MKEILLLTIISGLLFIGFLTILIVGLIKKKRKFVFIAIVILFFSICSGGWTTYLFVSKSYDRVTNIFKPRTGEEIYTALFGKTGNKCVKVLKYQDQIVPKIDYAIWLHFETCPDELKRILQLHNFQAERKSTEDWQSDGPLANDNWFKPETLGDTVLVFHYEKDEYGNGQPIYSSLDSTKVYCIDVLD